MKCMVCNNFIVVKRNIKTLFVEKKLLICDNCYKKNPISIDSFDIPLDNNKKCSIISLLGKDNKNNIVAYLIEYGKLVERFLKENILIFDYVYLDDKFYNFLNLFVKCINENIVILCFKCRI